MGAGLEGTNREWLRKQNEYDLLCRMENRLRSAPSLSNVSCMLYLLTGDEQYGILALSPGCPMRNFKTEEEFENFNCKDCIASWLNEKHS